VGYSFCEFCQLSVVEVSGHYRGTMMTTMMMRTGVLLPPTSFLPTTSHSLLDANRPYYHDTGGAAWPVGRQVSSPKSCTHGGGSSSAIHIITRLTIDVINR